MTTKPHYAARVTRTRQWHFFFGQTSKGHSRLFFYFFLSEMNSATDPQHFKGLQNTMQ